MGLSNGGVIVFEPLNPTGKWSTFPPFEDGSAGAMSVESDNDDCGSSQPDFNDFRVRSTKHFTQEGRIGQYFLG